MKTLRNLFLACAGLLVCACNNDNEPQIPEGKARVEVRIVPPTVATRATQAAATTGTDGKLTVTGAYTVTLTHNGGAVLTETIEAGAAQKVATFEDVTSPTKVTVSLNNGQPSYTAAIDATLGTTAANAVPAYGETSQFSVKETTTSQSGTTTTYLASVTMAIPVARLEVGNISLKNGEDNFSTLTVGGVYLDDLRNRGGNYNAGKFECAATSTLEYQYGATENQFGTGVQAILKDDVSSVNFLTATLPATGVYAYNFFGATSEDAGQKAYNPSFKIYFNATQVTGQAHLAATPRYAMIKSYKKGSSEISLQNGKIYQIVGVEIIDENIVADEEGAAIQYNVEVQVTEAAWTIETITADWAQ